MTDDTGSTPLTPLTPLAALADAVRWWDQRVEAIPPDLWDAPTPCTSWPVRELVDHLTTEQLWAPLLLDGATIEEVGDRFDGDVLGADPARAAHDAAAGLLRALENDVSPDQTVYLSFGEATAARYARQLSTDHLVHGWDLAVATGQNRTMPDALAATIEGFIAAEGDLRSTGLFAGPVAVGAEASVSERVVAATGRDPGWAPPVG